MKKFLMGVTALALSMSLVACSNNSSEEPKEEEQQEEAAEEESEEPAEMVQGIYTIYNETGEEVTELYLIDNASGEQGENYAVKDGESAWSHGDPQTIVIDLGKEMPEPDSHGLYTLKFVTESGYEGKFETLSHEVAPIILLAEDDMTGETMIAFQVPEREAAYEIYNVSGEKVTELYIFENSGDGKGENLAGEGMADGDVITENWGNLPVNQEYTIEFTTESGYTGKFETLHVEKAPIYLIAADDMTGETQISFNKPE